MTLAPSPRFRCPDPDCWVDVVEAVGLTSLEELDCVACPACLAPMTLAPSPMTPEAHHLRHRQLHEALEELVADFMAAHGATPAPATVLHLLLWSQQQAEGPPTHAAHVERRV